MLFCAAPLQVCVLSQQQCVTHHAPRCTPPPSSRFQPVYVDEPSEDQTLAILKGLQERYERHHMCAYSEEALEAAVQLAHRYIADRFLPDKVSWGWQGHVHV